MSIFLYLLLLIPSVISMILLIKQSELQKKITKIDSKLPESFLDLLEPCEFEGNEDE